MHAIRWYSLTVCALYRFTYGSSLVSPSSSPVLSQRVCMRNSFGNMSISGRKLKRKCLNTPPYHMLDAVCIGCFYELRGFGSCWGSHTLPHYTQTYDLSSLSLAFNIIQTKGSRYTHITHIKSKGHAVTFSMYTHSPLIICRIVFDTINTEHYSEMDIWVYTVGIYKFQHMW